MRRETKWLRPTVLVLLLLCAAVARAQEAPADVQPGCWTTTGHYLAAESGRAWDGLKAVPHASIQRRNLAWELPIAAATGVLIATADGPVRRNPPSKSVSDATDTASNALLGAELTAAGLSYALGCATHRSGLQRAGLKALAGAGYAVGIDLALKAMTNREYPDKWNGHGRFWGGGKSFPSGHAAAAWAVASVLAKSYPQRRWVRWTAYGVATAIPLLRVPARKHYPSDIVVGGTLGYVAGMQLARP